MTHLLRPPQSIWDNRLDADTLYEAPWVWGRVGGLQANWVAGLCIQAPMAWESDLTNDTKRILWSSRIRIITGRDEITALRNQLQGTMALITETLDLISRTDQAIEAMGCPKTFT